MVNHGWSHVINILKKWSWHLRATLCRQHWSSTTLFFVAETLHKSFKDSRIRRLYPQTMNWNNSWMFPEEQNSTTSNNNIFSWRWPVLVHHRFISFRDVAKIQFAIHRQTVRCVAQLGAFHLTVCLQAKSYHHYILSSHLVPSRASQWWSC